MNLITLSFISVTLPLGCHEVIGDSNSKPIISAHGVDTDQWLSQTCACVIIYMEISLFCLSHDELFCQYGRMTELCSTTCNMIKEKEARKVRISHYDRNESPTEWLTFTRGQTVTANKIDLIAKKMTSEVQFLYAVIASLNALTTSQFSHPCWIGC